ncbi:MAG: hypothetical protein ABSE50_10730 [Xanthobacteraceae bacterium]
MSVGARLPRIEAADKATGRARYVDDVKLPGMLHVALLTSPHAHARICGYRLDAARAVGVMSASQLRPSPQLTSQLLAAPSL